jgi:sulfur carrier protein
MHVTVNGKRHQLPEGATLTSVVELLPSVRSARGIAIALDGEVVPRTAWADTHLTDGTRVEVLVAVQGG